ncbi:MAG: hypothetical protein QOF56_1593 [Acidobacteriaceae bacterium]|nr:hypothetical protein [Acidobacteriaceae bacterium]
MCVCTDLMPTASTRGRRQKAEQVPSVVAHHAETPANPLRPESLQWVRSSDEAIRFRETTADS